MFGKGAFTIDPNATPEQIAQKRAYIAAMMPRFGSAKYVGEGLGQLATGVMVGRQNKKLDGAESAGRKSADELFAGLIGKGSTAPGSFSVLGAAPMDGPPMPPPDPNSPHALGDDAMSALGKPPVKTAADPVSIKAGLVARGLPDHVADGFVMNMQDESGLNPGINELNPIVPGSRGGFGLYQLTGPRRKAYEAYAAQKGVPVDDVDAQLDFLMMEMQGPESKAAQAILSTKSPGEAGAAIVNEFLRPSPEYAASRASEYLAGGGMPSGAQPGAPAPAGANATTPMIPPDQVAAALANPWLSQEQRAMLTSIYDQQVQAGDPMRQLELQKAELELQQMQAPAAPPEEMTTRMLLMEQAGLDPQSEEGRAYMLTGELPEPPKPGYRQMTPEEVAANPRLDPSKAYQVSPDGKVETIGGGGTSVTVDMGTDAGRYLYGTDAGVPAGWRVDRETGIASPIPGGPAAVEAEQLALKEGNKDNQGQMKMGTTLESINLNLSEIENGGLPVTGALGDARRTWLGRALTGDSAMDFGNRTNQITDSAALAEVQNMRDNSPTGGAVGSLTDDERKAIGNSVTALNNSTSAEEYARAAKAYRELALNLAYGEGKWELAEDGTVRPKGAGTSAGSRADADGWTTLPNGVKVRVKQ